MLVWQEQYDSDETCDHTCGTEFNTKPSKEPNSVQFVDIKNRSVTDLTNWISFCSNSEIV